MGRGVIVYGDPHGEWRPLLRACRDDPPDGVVLVGDCDLDVSLRTKLAPLFEAGIKVRWIAGNHDFDDALRHDRLFLDHPSGDLHGRWCQLGGSLIAGLGGIFREQVWYPRFGPVEAGHRTRRSFARSLRPAERWRGGLPLHVRDAIFPEDIAALSGLRLDVLVSHEAPSCHPKGFVGVDLAAEACRASLVIHGHHHESGSGELANGTRVVGLAKAEVYRLAPEELG